MSGKFLNQRYHYNLILFFLNFIYIFVIGLFSEYQNIKTAYYIIISLIYFFSTLTVETSINRKKHLYFPIAIVILLWIGFLFHLPLLIKITSFLSTLFFLIVIVLMVFQIAKSKKIGRLEFLEAVNTYLLFGIAASILFKAVYVIDPNTFTSSLGTFDSRSDFIYFSFVTLTTLGYGDILPVSAAARSLVVFFSVSGQLYLTMIIALLVGKYLNAKKIE